MKSIPWGRIAAASVAFAACSAPPPPPKSTGWVRRHSDPPETSFARPKALAEITTRKPPSLGRRRAPVTGVDLAVSGPYPRKWTNEGTPAVDDDTLLLARRLRGAGHRATLAGQCVARALAEFFVQHGGPPDSEVKAYVLGKCRAPWAIVSIGWFMSKPDGPVKDWRAKVEPRMQALIDRVAVGKGPRSYGLAMAKDAGTVAMVLAYGPTLVTLHAVERKDYGAKYRVRGRVKRAESLLMHINRGPYQVERCRLSSKVTLPEFSAECTADPRDDETWIQLGAFDGDGTVGQSLVRILVSPSLAPPKTYRAASLGLRPSPIRSNEDLERRVSAAVRFVRAKAGLKPLEIDVGQSEVAESLAPYFFGAPKGAPGRAIRETITSGLRAGWRVGASVTYGAFVASLLTTTKDDRAILASLLSRPFARRVLVDPDVNRIAIGPLYDSTSDRAGVLVATYATVDEIDYARFDAEVWARLVEVRRRAGRGPPRRWGRHPHQRQRTAQALFDNRITGHDARAHLAHQYRISTRQGIDTLMLQAHLPRLLPWPERIVDAFNPTLDLVVGYRTPAGHAWGRYEVIVMVDGQLTPSRTLE